MLVRHSGPIHREVASRWTSAPNQFILKGRGPGLFLRRTANRQSSAANNGSIRKSAIAMESGCRAPLRSSAGRTRLRGDGVKRSMLRSILTDVQLWVPVGVLILGTSLLMILRDS